MWQETFLSNCPSYGSPQAEIPCSELWQQNAKQEDEMCVLFEEKADVRVWLCNYVTSDPLVLC
jgi:hypothetical protein